MVLNKAFKSVIKQQFQEWCKNQIQQQLEKGKAPQECQIDISIGTIRGQSVALIMAGWERCSWSRGLSLDWKKLDPCRYLSMVRGRQPSRRANGPEKGSLMLSCRNIKNRPQKTRSVRIVNQRRR